MKKLVLSVLLGLAVISPQEALACNIPVFRYALERWGLTPYDVLVYHRGPLPADLQQALKAWSDFPDRANVEITVVNLDEEITPLQRKYWERYAKFERTPWMLVTSQAKNAPDTPAWSGPCTAANLRSVLDSPMRQTILAHLTRGASITYVLLTSADAKADRTVYDMARQHLPILEKKIKLGKQDEDGPNKLQWPIPLKMSLPLFVLDRKDPAESAFVRMLLNTEEGLDEINGPILFAVFGRGRALPIYGKYLDEDNLVGLTRALSGPCSCEIKDQNPGVDLLMLADWKAFQEVLFDGKDAVPLPKEMPTSLPYREVEPLPVVKTNTPAPTETKWQANKIDEQIDGNVSRGQTIVTVEAPSEDKPPCNFCLVMWIGIGVAGGLVVVTGAWVAVVLLRG